MDSPIRCRARELTNKVEAAVPMNIHNRFDVEVIDTRTGMVRQRAQAENIICSQLWTQLFTPATYFNYIHYGTGSGTPASANTSLFTFLGYGTPSSSNDTYAHDETNRIYSVRRKIQLSETTAVGSTLTEVGIGYGTTAETLCTHAMLKDANGNQISIAKTNTDIINIYATIFTHYGIWNGITVETSLLETICGMLSFAYEGKYVDFTCTTSSQSGSLNNGGNNFTLSFDTNAKKITLTSFRFAAGVGNGGGITSILLEGYTSSTGYLPLITASVPSSWYAGSDIVGEAIGTGDGTTTAFATDFPYATNATIYADGVAVPATVTSQATLGNNIAITAPPASGAVITADYHTPTIAKDSDHVFDLTVTIQLGEYMA